MQHVDQFVAADAERLGGGIEVEAVAGLVLHLGEQDRLALQLGARVIQLPSGNWPTISEWACWPIWRISVRR